jgi:hypothetical protein
VVFGNERSFFEKSVRTKSDVVYPDGGLKMSDEEYEPGPVLIIDKYIFFFILTTVHMVVVIFFKSV